MILVRWSCDVPQEKLESFLKFVEEKMKPFYESYGCKRFELFIPMKPTKKYFSYQITQKRNRYTEQVVFDDIKSFEKFLEAVEKDTSAKEIVESYGRNYNVSSCSFNINAKSVVKQFSRLSENQKNRRNSRMKTKLHSFKEKQRIHAIIFLLKQYLTYPSTFNYAINQHLGMFCSFVQLFVCAS